MVGAGVDKELQAVVFAPKVLQEYLLWLAVRIFHVIDKELLEVTSHNPPRMLGDGQAEHITLRLLERSEHGAVALFDRLAQVFR